MQFLKKHTRTPWKRALFILGPIALVGVLGGAAAGAYFALH
jgi:hypothetical protein